MNIFKKNYALDKIHLGIIAIIILTILCQNRSLIIGYSVALGIIYLIKYPIKKRTNLYFIIILLILIQTTILAFVFKQGSTSGRLLIYKISYKILKDNFPQGIGHNKFELVYGDYQIQYFEDGQYSKQELLLADNVSYCYNDYLQIIIEYGITGLLVLFSIIPIIGLLILRSLKTSSPQPDILLFAIAHIIALGIAGCFSFIFYQLHWQCLFLASIGIVLIFNKIELKKYTPVFLSLVLICWLGIYFKDSIFNRKSLLMKTEALELFKSGYFDEANALYKQAYPELNTDHSFIREYAKSLILSREFEEAEKLMLRLTSIENSSLNFDLLADCYRKNGKFKEAEIYYLKSIHKVPNRFYSRFNLFSLYTDTKQTTKAISAGRTILELPVKFPSDNIDLIKTTVKNQLKLLESLNL